MKALKYFAIPWLAALAWAGPAQAAVTVSFIHPEAYTDAGLYSDYGKRAREATLDGIGRYLEWLGERNLRPGQTLAVEVLDIDLAGRFEPWRAAAYDVRFMNSVTWPRIKLRYRLVQNGRVLGGAEESIQIFDYLMQPSAYRSSDPLRYEKAMLDDWFKARFVRGAGARD